MKFPVAITARSFDTGGPAFEKLSLHCKILYVNPGRKRLTESELPKALEGAVGAIAGTERFSGPVLESSRDLKVISRIGSGTDNIDGITADRLGIRILNTPEAPVQAVAEHTIALILAIFKNLRIYQAEFSRGVWEPHTGCLLSGKTVGIIGMGRIGKRVATLLQSFGCGILFYDPYLSSSVYPEWKACDSLEDLLRAAEIISLHIPALEGNASLLSDGELRLCRRGSVIINTARGSLIQEGALKRALDEGIIAGAGLDVFPEEPYMGQLLTHQGVVATPHVASNTKETRSQMEIEAVENLIRALEGGEP
ncbi:MAG: phosphoglycerate dehydrogenase [Methanomicrobiales archaeon]|nr:phosphoglycerate dehydrogenase [Methanomicrobiales archaeon]